MAAVIRLKRKACDEPVEGLVIGLKKPKCELSEVNEVLFKFAATLNSEKESVRDHIQAALSKEKASKFSKWRNPKNIAISESTVKKLSEKLRAEHKNANEKKKLDYLNNRRLILKEEFQDLEGSYCKDAKVRQLFHLYDITEENEEVKKQCDEIESTITCNDEPLIREKVDDYVYDVYIADGNIDPTFVDETISVRPCTLTSDDLYFGDDDDSEECYEDDDDSNDENNWRNDYPEDNSEKNSDSEESSVSFDNDIEDHVDGGYNVDYDSEEYSGFSGLLQELDIECDHDQYTYEE